MNVAIALPLILFAVLFTLGLLLAFAQNNSTAILISASILLAAGFLAIKLAELSRKR
jgi:NADH:ubiquinone oxidoreductase subunit K